MMKFDTQVQQLKYKVLCKVAKEYWDGTLLENILEIPKTILPGKTPLVRCCVYKEREILAERIKLAMGGNQENPNVIEVIDIACDECPAAGYEVTDSCRGCLAHRCEGQCKVGAISFDHNHVAHIDKSKCVECGRCAKVCPFGAIINRKRPCQNACKVKAIKTNRDKTTQIDNGKCTSCGACMYQCPFGAIMDKSYILQVIDLLKNSDKTYALVAPAIAGQFTYASLGQVIAGIKALGFSDVREVALGADAVAKEEAKELAEKGFLMNSCCPAFVSYVEINFPDLLPLVSSHGSPMVVLAQAIKQKDPAAKVVFIGPCTAKKAEAQKAEVKPYIDAVLTFEELHALFESREIDVTALDEINLEDGSRYGRTFARSGGLTEAVEQALKEQGIEFEVNAAVCSGLESCKMALLKKSKNVLDANFLEGMACVDGCVGGPGRLMHNEKDKLAVDEYGKSAKKQTIGEAVADL